MLTVHTDLEQGSEEWHAARRGIVTASVVGGLLSSGPPNPSTITCPTCGAQEYDQCFSLTRNAPTPIKTPHGGRVAAAAELPPVIGVAANDTSRGLTARLVAERITGWTEDTPMTSDMWRGTECEPIARLRYAENYAEVTQVGFMRRDDDDGWTLGYSPDGLVGDDGLIEIKAPRAKTHLRTVLADEIPARYIPQCQAALLVSGRSWLDFVSFVGGMHLYVKRIEPDPKWHVAITAACIAFEHTAAQMTAAYTERVAGMPQTERIDFEIKVA